MTQARLHRFLERTKESKSDAELQRVGKKVTKLLGNKKVIEASKIVKKQDDSEPWGLDGQIKVCITFFLLQWDVFFVCLTILVDSGLIISIRYRSELGWFNC